MYTVDEKSLAKYAEFAVRIGANPQPEQTLIIRAPIEAAHFARLCATAAYAYGVKEVVVHYNDEKLSRIKMQYTDVEVLEDVKPWTVQSLLNYIESDGSACILSIVSRDPEIYKGLDSEKIDRANIASSKAIAPYREYILKDKIQWSIVAVPSPAWARKVFPNVSDDEAMQNLWQAIFDVCRVNEDDIVGAWKEHSEKLKNYKNILNEHDFASVHLKSSNGTNLTIGLAEDALWDGGSSFTHKNYEFMPNIPTEEIFTAPHKDKVNGIVYGTKPYVYNGNLIVDFCVTFKDGVVIDYDAKEGKELLGQLLDTDEGARRIGEIALVPSTSPINKSNILFYNTLFDENAACHIAFGEGYPGTVLGGNDMNDEQLLAKGVNKSLIHEDVMVGADDMTITGIKKDGETVLLFENGVWAF